MKLVSNSSQQCFRPVNMLSAGALHERLPFGYLSSYLFRT